MYCLRPMVNVEHGYEYIGKHYLHGLIGGEAMTQVKDGRAKVDQVFLV